MSSRKISSESFSSMGSDYLESPGEDGECPFSRVFWNGKSPVETLSCPFEDAAVSRKLELRKGEMYRVTEKCQDGWFKGTSLRSGASGVFPGNYVTPVSRCLLTFVITLEL